MALAIKKPTHSRFIHALANIPVTFQPSAILLENGNVADASQGDKQVSPTTKSIFSDYSTNQFLNQSEDETMACLELILQHVEEQSFVTLCRNQKELTQSLKVAQSSAEKSSSQDLLWTEDALIELILLILATHTQSTLKVLRTAIFCLNSSTSLNDELNLGNFQKYTVRCGMDLQMLYVKVMQRFVVEYDAQSRGDESRKVRQKVHRPKRNPEVISAPHYADSPAPETAHEEVDGDILEEIAESTESTSMSTPFEQLLPQPIPRVTQIHFSHVPKFQFTSTAASILLLIHHHMRSLSPSMHGTHLKISQQSHAAVSTCVIALCSIFLSKQHHVDLRGIPSNSFGGILKTLIETYLTVSHQQELEDMLEQLKSIFYKNQRSVSEVLRETIQHLNWNHVSVKHFCKVTNACYMLFHAFPKIDCPQSILAQQIYSKLEASRDFSTIACDLAAEKSLFSFSTLLIDKTTQTTFELEQNANLLKKIFVVHCRSLHCKEHPFEWLSQVSTLVVKVAHFKGDLSATFTFLFESMADHALIHKSVSSEEYLAFARVYANLLLSNHRQVSLMVDFLIHVPRQVEKKVQFNFSMLLYAAQVASQEKKDTGFWSHFVRTYKIWARACRFSPNVFMSFFETVLQNTQPHQTEEIVIYMLELSPPQTLCEKMVEIICASTMEHHILRKTKYSYSELERLIGKCFLPCLRTCSEGAVVRILRTLCAIPIRCFSEANQIHLMNQVRVLASTSNQNGQVQQYASDLMLKCSHTFLCSRNWNIMEKSRGLTSIKFYFSGREFLSLWKYLRSDASASLDELFSVERQSLKSISLEEMLVNKTAQYVVENCLETPLGDAFVTLQSLEELGKSFCQPPDIRDAHSTFVQCQKLARLYTSLMNKIQAEQNKVIRLETKSGYSQRAVKFFVENCQTCVSWFRRLSTTLLRTSFVCEMHSSVIMHALSLLDFANTSWWKTTSAFAVPKKCSLSREELFIFSTCLIHVQDADSLSGLLYICDSSVDAKAHLFVSACLNETEGHFEEALLSLETLLDDDLPSSPLSEDCIALVSARILELYRLLDRWDDFKRWSPCKSSHDTNCMFSNSVNMQFLHNLQVYSQLTDCADQNTIISASALPDAQFELSILQMTLNKKTVNVTTKRERHFVQLLEQCCSVLKSSEYGESLPVLIQFSNLQSLRNIQETDQFDSLRSSSDPQSLFRLFSSLSRILSISAHRSDQKSHEPGSSEYTFHQKVIESFLDLSIRLQNRSHAQAMLPSLDAQSKREWYQLLLGTRAQPQTISPLTERILGMVNNEEDFDESPRILTAALDQCLDTNDCSIIFEGHYLFASYMYKRKVLPAMESIANREHVHSHVRHIVDRRSDSLTQHLEQFLAGALSQHFSHSTVYCSPSWIQHELLSHPELSAEISSAEIIHLISKCSKDVITVFGECVKSYLLALKVAPPNAHHVFAETSLVLLEYLVKCVPILQYESQDSAEAQSFVTQLKLIPHPVWQHAVPQLMSLLHSEYSEVKATAADILIQIGKTRLCSVVFDLCAESVQTKAEMIKRDIKNQLSELSSSHDSVIRGVTFLFDGLQSISLSHEEKWIYQLNAIQKRFKHQYKQFEHHLGEAKKQGAWGNISVATLQGNYTLCMADVLILLKTCFKLTCVNSKQQNRIDHYQEDFDQLMEIILAPCAPDNKDLQRFHIYDQFLAAATSLQKKLQHASKKVVDLRTVSSLCSSHVSMHHIPIPNNSTTSFSGIEDESVGIASIFPTAEILSSKTQPKKMRILASDGVIHTYLLKSKEDLHLDRRVMQFLHIVNCFLKQDKQSCSRNLHASHFSVLPLDSNCGLIQWVDEAFPVLSLYREKAQTKGSTFRPQDDFFNKLIPLLKNDKRSVHSHSSRYPKRLLRSVVAELIAESDHDLLDQRLRVSSTSSYDWLVTNSTFNQSSAVMSIIGYVIGLGDRHLDNILVNYSTGRVTHIDFNVCFDKGMKLKIPEIVPFRLTPVIRRALGVNGSEGQFSATANIVSRVIETNADTLLGFLASFLHDPLVEWTHTNTISKYFCSSIPVSDTNLSVVNEEFVSFFDRYVSFLNDSSPVPQSIMLLRRNLNGIFGGNYKIFNESLFVPQRERFEEFVSLEKVKEKKIQELDRVKAKLSKITTKESSYHAVLSKNDAKQMIKHLADFTKQVREKLDLFEHVQEHIFEYDTQMASDHIATLGKAVESFELISTLCAEEIITCHKSTSISKLRKLEKSILKHLKQKLKEDQKLLQKLDLYRRVISTPFTSANRITVLHRCVENCLSMATQDNTGGGVIDETLCDDAMEILGDFLEPSDARRTLITTLESFATHSITQLETALKTIPETTDDQTESLQPPNLPLDMILADTINFFRTNRRSSGSKLHSGLHINQLALIEQLQKRCVVIVTLSNKESQPIISVRASSLQTALADLILSLNSTLEGFTTQTVVEFVNLFSDPAQLRSASQSLLDIQREYSTEKDNKTCACISQLVPSLYTQCEHLCMTLSHFQAELTSIDSISKRMLASCFGIGGKLFKEILHMSEHIAETNCVTVCHNLSLELEKLVEDLIVKYVLPPLHSELDAWRDLMKLPADNDKSIVQLQEWDARNLASFSQSWQISSKRTQYERLLEKMSLWLQSLRWNSDESALLSNPQNVISDIPTRAQFLQDLRQEMNRVQNSSQQLIDYFDKYLEFEQAAVQQLNSLHIYEDKVRNIQKRDVSFKQLDHFDAELHELMKSVAHAEGIEMLFDSVRGTIDTLGKIPQSLQEFSKYSAKLSKLENNIISFEKKKSMLIVEIRQIRDEQAQLDHQLQEMGATWDRAQVLQLCHSIGIQTHLDLYLQTLKYIVENVKIFSTWVNMHHSRMQPVECITKPNDLHLVTQLADDTLAKLHAILGDSQKWLHEDAPKSGPMCALYLLNPETIDNSMELLRSLLSQVSQQVHAIHKQSLEWNMSTLTHLDLLLRGMSTMEWLSDAHRQEALTSLKEEQAKTTELGDTDHSKDSAQQQQMLFVEEYSKETLPRIRHRMNHFGVALEDHVKSLIKDATNIEKLCQLYEGWSPWL
eukprot:CAMPEP_0117435854 /NCGR_PEP_ID=MMETSP0759-20121206/700_1 /TAXON_ID=63605 /ORGANISM="Percolomonas cosmopolitus, Strain WS" /LENGTH=3053 /DNA_ID=CAMNT_0005227423 /DNA_START=330 /DNA_END=9492 /DNA_ORIENTATION=+